MQNAVLMVIDDQNAEGGVTIAGRKYMLNPIIRDTKFDLLVGKSVTEELFDKGVKAIAGTFVEFLDGQDNMDSVVWMEGFAQYHWDGLFGFENYWVGKPLSGIDRQVFGPSWVGEWTDDKLVLKWAAPLSYDIFVGE
jgi:hypothetical protein